MAGDSVLHALVAQAARAGADALEVEYKDGCEEVVAMRGPIGFGIASFRSGGAEATALRRELHGMAKRRTTITVDQIHYDVRMRIYDSFGEEAFRVEFEQTGGKAEQGRCTRPRPRGRSAETRGVASWPQRVSARVRLQKPCS